MTAEVIVLKYPYRSSAGEEITQLTVRRATVGDIKKLRRQGDPVTSEITLLASLVGKLPEDLEPMDQVDFLRIQAAYLKQVEESTKSLKPNG